MRFSLALRSLVVFCVVVLLSCGWPRHVSGTMKYCDDIAIRLVLLIGSCLTSTFSSAILFILFRWNSQRPNLFRLQL